MSDRTTRRSSPLQIAFLTLAGLVIYALSPGPVGWIVKTYHLETVAPYLNTVYYPLVFFYHHFPLLTKFYDAYFALFGLR